jgi:hypothetical protein
MANDDPYSLKKPCANCPFRRVGAIELQPGRVEGIIQDLINGELTGFTCHKTAYGPGTSRRPKEAAKECAGALIVLEKLGHQTQLMQVMHRMGAYEPESLVEHHNEVIDAPDVEFERHFFANSVKLRTIDPKE